MNKLRYFFVLLSLVIFSKVNAQDSERKHSIGLYQNTTDYNVSLLNNKVFAFDSSLSHSFRVAYQRRLSRSWMLNTGLSNGFILNQNIQESFVKKAYAFGIDAAVILKMNNGKLLKENPRIAPFLSFGYRTDYIPSLKKIDEQPWLFHNQYGAGLNIKLAERSHIQMQVAMDQKLQGDFNTHMQYRIGLTQSLGKYDEEKPKSIPNLDSDQDGIVDSRDDCPGLFGIQANNGCPDTTEYIAKKIELDSLIYLLTQQDIRIQALELENAKLRAGLNSSDSGSISSSREQELLLRIYNMEKDHKLSIVELERKIKQSDLNSDSRIDTVYKTEILYKDNPEETKWLAELNSLKQINKDLESQLKNNATEAVRVDTVYKTEIVYKDRVVQTDNSNKLEQEKLELARKWAAEKAANKEADKLAQEARNKAEKDVSSTDTATRVVENPTIPEDKNYYVITISSPNISTAKSWLKRMKKDFSTARILPQPNGYYRVGVFAAKDRQLAGEILERVKQLGYNPAWLSVE